MNIIEQPEPENSEIREQILGELKQRGLWDEGNELEQFVLLKGMAPAGALDNIHLYRLILTDYHKPRGLSGRNWQPIALITDDFFSDSSPEILTGLIHASDYFKAPELYGELLLIQFHRFALDFYKGYQVREENINFQNHQLHIAGSATRAYGGKMRTSKFNTVVDAELGTNFEVEDPEDQHNSLASTDL